MKKTILNATVVCAALGLGLHWAHAEAFSFDRPGDGFSTSIVPKGHVAWEQSLPTLSYDDGKAAGDYDNRLTIQADMLFRIGLGADTELRLGWDGPVWQRNRVAGDEDEIHGNGDINIGLKKAMKTGDERLQWALLLQAQLATAENVLARNDLALASNDKNIYTLGSSVQYQFSDNIQTGITMLYDYQDGDLAWSAIPGIQYKISNKVSGFAEYKYRKQESLKKESVVNNGVIWSLRDNLQLDAWVGYRFNEQNPRIKAGLGASYLF